MLGGGYSGAASFQTRPRHVPKYSPMRSEPAKSIPMTLTRVMSFRPVEKPILPDQVNRRITSIMVYIVNPYMHDG